MVIMLLQGILENEFVNVPLNVDQTISVVNFSIANQLVYRTEMGNFKVSDKGIGLINSMVAWESLETR